MRRGMNPIPDDMVEQSAALLAVYEGIGSGRLNSYATLKDQIRTQEGRLNRPALLEQGFKLLRQLYWGFFRELKPDTHPRIWRELVVADRSYPQFGELKRFAAIPNIFLALIDIHGYTAFCREARHNISKVDLLDRMIQEDITLLCVKAGVLNRRVRGDEILILGASPFDVLEAVDRIRDYFSRRRRIKHEDKNIIDASQGMELPDFKLSAGIAGGQKYASLVITREGDLSGDIVNTAARLQARANKISPDRNRVLITTQVCQSLGTPQTAAEKDLMKRFGFFSVGNVEFKGLSIGVYDLIILPDEAWRLEYRATMDELLVALDKGLWRKEVLESALQLTSRLSVSCPGFADDAKKRGQVTGLSKQSLAQWHNGQYEAAIDSFGQVVGVVCSVSPLDDVVLEYLLLVFDHYRRLRVSFIDAVERLIEDSPPLSLGQDERKVFLTIQKHAGMYRHTKETLRLKHLSRGEEWGKACDELRKKGQISLLSPK